MAKVRVYELARELSIESKLLVNTLKTIGVSVASHQSTLSDEQVDQLKKAMAGEMPAAQPQAAAAGSRRVIRRRRKEAEVEEPAVEEPVVSESKEVAPAAVAKSSDEDIATPAEVAPTVEAVASSPETPVAENEVKDVTAKAAAEPEEAKVVKVAEPAAVEKPKKRKSAFAATIVRKATPEEVERSQNLSQQRANRSRTSKEDSRGTKFTGFTGKPKAQQSAAAAAPRGGAAKSPNEADALPDPDNLKTTSRRKPKETKKRESEAEESARKSAIPSSKDRRGGYNTLQLLNVFSKEDVVSSDLARGKPRTVYTPNAAQRRRDLKRRKDLKKTEITVARSSYRIVKMGSEIQVGELAKQLKIKSAEIIKKLMMQGIMVTINQNIDLDTATLIATEYNFEVKSVEKKLDDILGNENELTAVVGDESRPPIVTVMGHVDHGKTSILDAIRNADIASGESGGITQHIGAYSIIHDGKQIAFLDTPGHEAFSSMRARGANATDIVVLVVAADDGVMPQTVEAISHAKAAGVPIIVAMNKMDKENINIDRVFTELTEHGIQSEEWGGDTQFVKVSAVTRLGIDELIDAILLQSEVLELKTTIKAPAAGIVVEAHLDKGRGPVATVMVQHGTLKKGEYIVAGTEFGKVRAMRDHNGKNLVYAGPSTPVEILGLSAVPRAGDKFNAVKDDAKAREVVGWRKDNAHMSEVKSSAQSLEDLLGKMQSKDSAELPLIIKGDTQGSVEAVCESITKLNREDVRTKIIHKAVGGITESDISLSEASGAVIIGFNVRAARGLDDSAENRGVLIEYYAVIYDLVDAVKNLMAGKLPPILEEIVIGKAEVRQPISVPKIGTIAGSAVLDGRITRNSSLRLIRDEIVIYDGKVGSLRRFKDDVKEVKSGYECGISFENYNDVKIGDVIEAYEIKETAATF